MLAEMPEEQMHKIIQLVFPVELRKRTGPLQQEAKDDYMYSLRQAIGQYFLFYLFIF